MAAAVIAAISAYAQTRPDPLTQATKDGCGRDRIGIFLGRTPNWAYVNDKDYPASGPPPPPQWAKGYARSRFEAHAAVHPTSVDMPTTHSAYDVITNLAVDPAYAFLVSGDEERRVGNFKDKGEFYGGLHTEWEETAFPIWAWPERGDRIEMKGSWVWDCDHAEEGEHSEIHPPRAVWAQRNPGGVSPRSPFGEAEATLFISTDKTPAGTQADCAHASKGDEGVFRACVRSDSNWQDVSGAYTFFLPAPPKPSTRARLRVRVVDRGTTRGIRVRAVAARGPSSQALYAKTTDGVRVSVTLAATPGRRIIVAKQVFVGWTPVRPARLPEHVRVTVTRLTVRRAMDPGCPPAEPACTTPQTTRPDQISRGPGEYLLYLDVAGTWTRLPLVRARDGQSVRLRRSVDVYVPRGKPWRVYITGRECDNGIASSRGQRPPAPCPRSQEFPALRGDDDPGFVEKRFRSPAAALGRHRLHASLAGSTCPATNRAGCYAVELVVTRVNDAARRARRAG